LPGKNRIPHAAHWFATVFLALSTLMADARVAWTADAFTRNRGVNVETVRIGNHGGKTRIVLDLSGPVDFDYRISEHGKAIVVRLPEVTWKARDYLKFGPQSTIYRISFFPNPGTGGGVLSILARRRVGLSAVDLVPPGGKSGHRLVLDIPDNIRSAHKPSSGVVRDGRIYPLRVKSRLHRQSKRRMTSQVAERRR